MGKFKARIIFNVTSTHPNIEYIANPGEPLEFTDEYYFSSNYTIGDVEGYIKNDLLLVAGGGYNTDHIYNVKFEIEKIA